MQAFIKVRLWVCATAGLALAACQTSQGPQAPMAAPPAAAAPNDVCSAFAQRAPAGITLAAQSIAGDTQCARQASPPGRCWWPIAA